MLPSPLGNMILTAKSATSNYPNTRNDEQSCVLSFSSFLSLCLSFFLRFHLSSLKHSAVAYWSPDFFGNFISLFLFLVLFLMLRKKHNQNRRLLLFGISRNKAISLIRLMNFFGFSSLVVMPPQERRDEILIASLWPPQALKYFPNFLVLEFRMILETPIQPYRIIDIGFSFVFSLNFFFVFFRFRVFHLLQMEWQTLESPKVTRSIVYCLFPFVFWILSWR
jgi:hypothetical protein